MLNIIIFGAPGSGKGTQSDLLKKHYDLAHISTGDVLRAEMKAETDLGKIAKGFIDKGQLVPDELICEILDKKVETLKGAKGIIFDGFPRTVPQAEELDKILRKHGTEITVLLDLHVGDEELVIRLLERGKISGRSDDNEETIQARLKVYHTQTAPLSEYYKTKGKHLAIKGTGSIEEIFAGIKQKVELWNQTL